MSSPPQYVITDYTKRQARKLGVKVKHSTRKTKNRRVRQTARNSPPSADSATPTTPHQVAHGRIPNTRRKLYRIRHERDRHMEGKCGVADKLLW
jgi:hypothetical protein